MLSEPHTIAYLQSKSNNVLYSEGIQNDIEVVVKSNPCGPADVEVSFNPKTLKGRQILESLEPAK